MSTLAFLQCGYRARLGLKGPRALPWLAQQGIEIPQSASTWQSSRELLIARLGSSEFFMEEGAGGSALQTLAASLATAPSGVYPVLREDAAFVLSGDAAHDVLAQVCSIDFAQITAASCNVIMTMMIGVAVVVVVQEIEGERRYRIWCDPTFGAYLGATLGTVVMESGGQFTGVSI